MIRTKSIAVLPFESLTPDQDNTYFADGMSEEIILALSRVDGLKVTARTSSFAYRDRKTDVRIIGNQLGVATVLNGSIRKVGNRIRIHAQLVRTDNGFHLWSERFDRELTDIFELQDEISLLIAEKIRENYGHLDIDDHLVTSKTRDIKAYQMFLKGRFYQLQWKSEDFDRAIHCYKQSIELDPAYYQPYFGLVQCYGILGSWGFMNKLDALTAADFYLTQGIALQPESTDAYFAKATQALWINWDPHSALQALHKGLVISPQDTESLESAAECHTALGQFDQALEYINKALEYNPLSPNHHYTKGNIYYLQKQYDTAMHWMDKALAIDLNWELAIRAKACCYILKGQQQELVHWLSRVPKGDIYSKFLRLYEAMHLENSLSVSDFATDTTIYLPWAVYAPLYTGDQTQALASLNQGIQQRNGQYINFGNDPLLRPLHPLPEFQQLVQNTFPSAAGGVTASVQKEKASTKLSPEEAGGYKSALQGIMENEQAYLSPELNLRELAARIDLHPNKLSWLLNETLGQNFNEYINTWRLNAFQQKAVLPEFSHYTILGLAYDCGFNSKSVFNDFFKKSTGQTPSAWLKANR